MATACGGAPHRLRVYQYYLPVFFWVRRQMQEHQHKFAGKQEVPPLVVSTSGPVLSERTHAFPVTSAHICCAQAWDIVSDDVAMVSSMSGCL